MSTTMLTSSFSESYQKMDNVLYEIRDKKGILKNQFYEPWKEEILNDLKILDFIEENNDLWVLTETGREVIKNVSFKVYNQKIKSKPNKSEAISLQEKSKKESMKFWFWLMTFVQLFILISLILYSF